MTAADADVVVVGAGNAGLIAAITARECGARVVLLEASGPAERGGNSRFASAVFRFAHAGRDDLRTIVDPVGDVDWDAVEDVAYPAETYVADVVGTADAEAVDRELVRAFVAGSQAAVRWLAAHDVRWDLVTLPGSGPLVRLPRGGEAIVSGNGVALVEALFGVAERLGVDIRYGARARDLVLQDGTVVGVRLADAAGERVVRGHGILLACGGFEASEPLRRRHLGEEWAPARVRGSGLDDGTMLERALAHGAAPKGDWRAAHGVPIDTAAPAVGDLRLGDDTARYSFSFGITVNAEGARFTDEGALPWQFMYSEFGRRILAQPGGIAFQLFDARAEGLLEPRYATATPLSAGTIGDLAEAVGIDRDGLEATVAAFNAACPGGAFDPGAEDGMAARPAGQPPKSNWARPLDTPPFRAYPVTCGITFTTGGGLAADVDGRVLDAAGTPIRGLYAAGEILGGYFRSTVPTGAGLVRGAVLARRAGVASAAAARAAAGEERPS